MYVTIRSETTTDFYVIREIHAAAFRNDAEADLVDQLREEGYARLSLVAMEGEQLVGHIHFNAIHIDETPALTMAPMAMKPGCQRLPPD